MTAKAVGTTNITYTVTRKTITTTVTAKPPTEETVSITVDEYNAITDPEEQKKYTEVKDDQGNITGYEYKKVTEQEPDKST